MYLVERRTPGSAMWTSVAQVSAPTRRYVDDVGGSGGCFEYRVRARDADGVTGRGAPVQLMVGQAPSPSCAGLNYTAEGGSDAYIIPATAPTSSTTPAPTSSTTPGSSASPSSGTTPTSGPSSGTTPTAIASKASQLQTYGPLGIVVLGVAATALL